jgi:hypothetical protein
VRAVSEKYVVIVFRVSNYFFDLINEFCRARGMSYAELFERAIEYLCEKYLGEEEIKEEGGDGYGKEFKNGG